MFPLLRNQSSLAVRNRGLETPVVCREELQKLWIGCYVTVVLGVNTGVMSHIPGLWVNASFRQLLQRTPTIGLVKLA